MTLSIYTLPANQRIKSRDSLNRLFAEGKGGVVYPLRYIVLSEDSPGPGFRMMVSVPKRNHKRAVRRNLLKRRIREAFRLNKVPLQDFAVMRNKNIHLGIIYIAQDVHDFQSISDAVKKIIFKVTGNG